MSNTNPESQNTNTANNTANSESRTSGANQPKKTNWIKVIGYCLLAIIVVTGGASIYFNQPEPQIAEASYEDKIIALNESNNKLDQDIEQLQKEISIKEQEKVVNNETIKLYESQK
jgi:hypothetical protein